MLFIAFFLYIWLKIFSVSFASLTAWILWTLIYFYFILNFLDIYLDAIVVTKNVVIIYQWYGLFKNATDSISFGAIESVFSKQDWIINKIFNNGDIFLRRAWHTNVFNNVGNSWIIATNINKLLLSFNENLWNNKEDVKTEDSDFKVFIEAMAEIIKDYKNKW